MSPMANGTVPLHANRTPNTSFVHAKRTDLTAPWSDVTTPFVEEEAGFGIRDAPCKLIHGGRNVNL